MDDTQALALGLIVAYWLVLLITRWVFIAKPNRRFTLARIRATRFRLKQADVDEKWATELLDEARDVANAVDDRFDPDQRQRRPGRLSRVFSEFVGILIWNGSRDLVAWHLVHEVKAVHVDRYQDDKQLRARLARAQSELSELPPVAQQFWRTKLEDVINPPRRNGEPHPTFDAELAKATLHEYLRELYTWRDTKFVNLATQQNKVTWLILVALVVMGALVQLDFYLLMLAGAVGGVLSRLQRELVRRDVPSDYGVSWALMFLSPVAGALSAWAGLHLLVLLQELDIIDLASLLPSDVNLTDPTNGLFGLAVLLGISERFLDRIVRQVTETIAPEPEPAAAHARH
jgi:hypothetical protein